MKRNAIIRIIIWSTVIVLLVGIMGSVVSAKSHKVYNRLEEVALELTESTEVVIDNAGTAFEISGTVTENINVRSSPSTAASVLASLHPGDAVEIKRYEQVNGNKWVFIDAPVQGWILGKYVDLAAKESNVSGNTTEDAYGYGTSAEGLREMEITWFAGSITIEAADVDRILVEETMASDPKYSMICKQSGDKLFIEFCDDDLLNWNFGISIGEELSKDLTVLVPMDFTLDSLEVDAAAATLDVKNLVIGEVEFDGASGTCNFENCVVDQLDLDTASGDITFSGTLKTLDCDAASASVRAELDNVPNRIDMDSMSGDLELTLPEGAGFTLSMDAMSSDFISDFDTTVRNGNYISGDGSCRISMDGMSGDVYIRKVQSAAAAPETPIAAVHHHTDECKTNPDSCPDNASANHNETHHAEP